MAHGGFARDYQRSIAAKTKKAHADLKREREVIGERVTNNILSTINQKFEQQSKETEDKLMLKQDEIIAEFIQITHDRNRLLRFLLWTNAATLLGLSFTLGYFL